VEAARAVLAARAGAAADRTAEGGKSRLDSRLDDESIIAMMTDLRARRATLPATALRVADAALRIADCDETRRSTALVRAALTVACEAAMREVDEGSASAARMDSKAMTPRATSTPALPPATRTPAPSLVALLGGYFEYMARLGDGTSTDRAISLHQRPVGDGTSTTNAAAPAAPYRFERSAWPAKAAVVGAISIEDPFESVGSIKPHDLGTPLTTATAATLRGEYKRAAALLARHRRTGANDKALLEELLRSGPSPHRRRAEDGEAYSEKEFIEWYGAEAGRAKWAAAEMASAE